jgi:hypothetical protein
MRRDVARILVITLSLGLALTLSFTASVSSSGKKKSSKQSTDRSNHSSYDISKLGVENFLKNEPSLKTTKKISNNHSWMIEQKTFNLLSSTGQQAALMLNGMLETPQTPRQADQPERQFAMAIAPVYNFRVNVPSQDVFGQTQNQSTVAANGSNIVVSFNDTGNFSVLFGDINLSSYSVSTNGGLSFTQKRAPTPFRGFNLGNSVVTTGLNNDFFLATLSFDRDLRSIINVTKSTDGGFSFSQSADASTTAGNQFDFQDRCWIAVDKGNSSPFTGSVYISWTTIAFDGTAFINFARSINGGRTFEPPVQLTPRDTLAHGSTLTVAPNGEIYVIYENLGLGEIGIVKSTDGGRTFSSPKLAARFNTISYSQVTGSNGVRVFSFPQMAVDKNGNIHIVFAATRSIFSPDRSDIFYVRSVDGGSTFSEPSIVNDDNTMTTQINPAIAAASDGTIAVKWWDRRNDPTNDGLTDVYMVFSKDGGKNFGKNFLITDTNWLFAIKEPTLGDGYHGDYDGLTSDGTDFYLTWSDERAGNADVYFTRVPIDQNESAPDFSFTATKLFDTVIGGSTVEFDFKMTPLNGYSKNVTISAAFPAINGLSSSFDTSLLGGGNTSKMTISTTPTSRAGTYLIRVTATDGERSRSTFIRLTIYSKLFFGQNRTATALTNISDSPGFSRINTNGLKKGPDGVIHMVFEDDSSVAGGSVGGQVFYTQSTDEGRTYSTPVKISGESQISSSSALAVDTEGNIFVVWTDENVFRTLSTVFFSKSVDGGKTFSSAIALSTVSQNAIVPSIATNKNNQIMVTYSAVESMPVLNLFVTTSSDSGNSFSPPSIISLPHESAISSHIAFDSQGAAYVVYNDARIITEGIHATINLTIAEDGQNFDSPRMISGLMLRKNFLPYIAIDKKDNIYVSFCQGLPPGLEIEIMKSTDKGVTFGPQINVSKSLRNSLLPCVVTDDINDNTVYVVWDDTSTDRFFNPEILAARSTNGGATFSSAFNVSANSGISVSPSAVLDSTGNLVVAWGDDSSADSDIFASSVTFPKSLEPAISGFSSELLSVGSDMTILGTNFQDAQAIFFSGDVVLPKTNFSVSEDGSEISLKVPPGAGSGTVSVRTPYGTATSGNILTIVPADFNIILKPSLLSVIPGESATFNVGIEAVGYNQSINLSAVSPVSSIGVNFSEISLKPGTKTTLTVSTMPDTPPNFNFNIVITGKSGELVRTQTATVHITPPDYGLVFNQGQISVSPGDSVQVTLNINRTGNFAGKVIVAAPPEAKKFKIRVTPPNQETTGTSLNFQLKVKQTAKTGLQQLIFTGTDETGRVRNATIVVLIR